MGSPPQGTVQLGIFGYAMTRASGVGTTTSLTFVSCGQGVAVNSGPNGKVRVCALGFLFQSATADGIEWALYHNTTGIPANNVSVGTDTLHFSDAQNTVPATTTPYPYLYSELWTGLPVNTTIYVYQAYRAITAGTVSQDGGWTEAWPA